MCSVEEVRQKSRSTRRLSESWQYATRTCALKRSSSSLSPAVVWAGRPQSNAASLPCSLNTVDARGRGIVFCLVNGLWPSFPEATRRACLSGSNTRWAVARALEFHRYHACNNCKWGDWGVSGLSMTEAASPIAPTAGLIRMRYLGLPNNFGYPRLCAPKCQCALFCSPPRFEWRGDRCRERKLSAPVQQEDVVAR